MLQVNLLQSPLRETIEQAQETYRQLKESNPELANAYLSLFAQRLYPTIARYDLKPQRHYKNHLSRTKYAALIQLLLQDGRAVVHNFSQRDYDSLQKRMNRSGYKTHRKVISPEFDHKEWRKGYSFIIWLEKLEVLNAR